MKYTKPPLTVGQQASLLRRRGMIGTAVQMQRCLSTVSYYRLSGYWYPFREQDDRFITGTSFREVWSRYTFDRRIRLLVMDAIERIEVAVRSNLAHHHAMEHGAFAYAMDPSSLPKLTPCRHTEFLERVAEETERSREAFVKHFRTKYGDRHVHLPVWMAVEIMAFGTLLTFYRGSSNRVKQAVASAFGVPAKVFDSWLLTMSVIRNICAHHARLWNRELGVKPLIPRQKDYPEWHQPARVENRRLFCVLTICQHCLRKLGLADDWAWRLKSLLQEYPDIPRVAMGFPDAWQSGPIWQEPVCKG